jgi:hypothetical protein
MIRHHNRQQHTVCPICGNHELNTDQWQILYLTSMTRFKTDPTRHGMEV